MARFDKVGCFGLTEPLVGSGGVWWFTNYRKARRRYLDS